MSKQTSKVTLSGMRLSQLSGEVQERAGGNEQLTRGLYFTLHKKLLDEIAIQFGDDRISAADMQFERELSSALGGQHIGWWRGDPIASAYLSEPPSDALPLEAWNDNEVLPQDIELVRAAIEKSQAHLDRIQTALAAYVGWLLINPTFVREHDQLLTKHQATIAARGIPSLGNFNLATLDSSRLAEVALETGRVENASQRTFVAEFQDFYIRWRLQGLSAPYVPEPLGPQFPVLDPLRMSNQMVAGGLTLFLPDTFPTPGRDELRNLVEQALGRHSANPPEHLQTWMELIAGDTMSKNQLNRYTRIARLQHYWTALHSRYAAQLKGSKGKLITAFAKYHHLSDDAIKNDLTLIDERMNGNWPRPYAIGS